MSGVVVRAAEPGSLDEIRTALQDAFTRVQAAVADEQPVILVVPAEDLLGHREPEHGAYVGALVGLARAVAFEGTRPGWRINVLAVPSDREVSDTDALAYAGADGLSGQVITLGTSLVGKVAP